MTAPARLVLLRHGATDAGPVCVGRRVDAGLSEEGRLQAVAAAARLTVEPDRLVASPLKRARETAAAFGPDPEVDDRLAERDFGDWEGRSWADIWSEVEPAVLSDPVAYAAITPPGGEAAAEVRARVTAALVELTAAPGATVLAVTHAGPLRLSVAIALGLDDRQMFALGAPHGRAAVLARHGEGWVLEQLGA